jgi:uncharacterized protein
MANQILDAERALVALFDNLTRLQRMALLARLEVAGGGLYRALAADEKNVKAREKLLAAAGDEEKNGALLHLMSTPKDSCEKCHRALPREADGNACSFQCTFCDECATALKSICPNCGGALEPRATLQARMK